MDAYGAWTLRVSDNQGGDEGRFDSWTPYVELAPPPSGPCECGGDGDFDGDEDSDLADVAGFQRCFTGSGTGMVLPGCEAMNLDCDTDIDLGDFA
jgi:hypothetical protein